MLIIAATIPQHSYILYKYTPHGSVKPASQREARCLHGLYPCAFVHVDKVSENAIHGKENYIMTRHSGLFSWGKDFRTTLSSDRSPKKKKKGDLIKMLAMRV